MTVNFPDCLLSLGQRVQLLLPYEIMTVPEL
jgi:hypothetical protein